MDYISILVLAVAIINAVLTVVLQTQKLKSRSHFWFRFVGYSLTAWCISMFFYRLSDGQAAVTWAKLLYFSAGFISPMFFMFGMAFPDKKIPLLPKLLTLGSSIFVGITCLTTDLFISDVTVVQDSENIIHFGTLYFWIYQFYVPLFFTAFFIIMIKRYINSDVFNKLQIKYILIGTFITSLLAQTTNLTLPSMGNFSLNWMGQVVTVIWISFISYTILKHRLFGIKYFYAKFLFLIVSAIPPYIVYFGLAYFYESNWGTSLTRTAFILGIPVSFLFVLFNRFLYTQAEKHISSAILYGGENPYESYVDFAKKINQLTHNEKIISEMERYFERLLTISNIRFIPLFKSQELSSNHNFFKDNKEILEKLLHIWNINNNKILLKYELPYIGLKMKTAEEISEFMTKDDFSIIAPVVIKDEPLAILLVGERDDQNPIDKDSIEIISNFVSALSLAVERNQLYKRLQDVNKNLEQKVDKATSQLRERNQELEQLYNDLEQLYQKEKDLMDIAGHEFRTPASIIKTNLHMLKSRLKKLLPEKEKEDEKISKYFERLMDSTDRQIRLINTFLESARIENERFELHIETADFVKLIADAVHDHEESAKAKRLNLKFDEPDNKMNIEIDPVRMREVIDNLLSNAIKYTKSGYVEVKISETADKVRCEVHDTGIGIKEEHKNLLFKKFSRLEKYIGGDEGKIVKPGGTGLGLFVSKNVVDHHGGDIWVESEVGKGSTFIFEIPKKQKGYKSRPKREDNGSKLIKPEDME